MHFSEFTQRLSEICPFLIIDYIGCQNNVPNGERGTLFFLKKVYPYKPGACSRRMDDENRPVGRKRTYCDIVPIGV
jgi:hypothetical protein